MLTNSIHLVLQLEDNDKSVDSLLKYCIKNYDCLVRRTAV